MTDSIVPRSDQINADDLISGPATITITGVSRGVAEQPVDMANAEFPGRAYRPSKTMRRMIVAAWGTDASVYVGRKITIYRDPDITFGKDRVGGIRISHLSHIDKRLSLALTVTRGKRAFFTVDPLPDAPPPPPTQDAITPEMAAEFERDIAEAATIEALDAVASDLKACDLGSHRARLLTSWSERKAVLEASE